METKFKMGDQVTYTPSGFTGTVTAVAFYMGEPHPRYHVTGKSNDTSKEPDSAWISEGLLKGVNE